MISHFHLKFDEEGQFGSAEHYYHFLWGYLLPAVSLILDIKRRERLSSQTRFLFRSCGPVMDRILQETGGLLDLDYELVGKDHQTAAATNILVPRWDVALKEMAWLISPQAGNPYGRGLAQRWRYWRRAAALSGRIRSIRRLFLDRVTGMGKEGSDPACLGKFLILKRSPQPAYYEHGGQAEIPTYGITRRTLVGLDASVTTLQERGMSVALFEPGSVSLAEQIRIFSQCKGIAGIYGAEFANVIWMSPHTPVIWIYNQDLARIPQITKELSRLLSLRFIPVRVEDDSAPMLPLDVLSQWA